MYREEITILGAGHGGRAFAVYLANSGFKVNLGFRTLHHIREIHLSKRIVSNGVYSGIYHLYRVSNHYEQMIKNSKIILIVLPASVHNEIIQKIIPYLHDGQIILLNPGRTWGAIEIFNKIKQQRPELQFYVGETQTLLFTSRKIDNYGVQIISLKESVDICFYPEVNNSIVEPIIQEIFPQFQFVNDIRITSLNNIGAVIHPAIVLLNTGGISRQNSFLFYREGVIPQIARVIEQVDLERNHIMRSLGLKSLNFLQWVRNTYRVDATDYYEAFQIIEPYREIYAPTTIQMRYLTEDIPTGLVPLSSIGHYLNIPTPTIDSLIQLAEILLCIDFKKNGRTIENVGIPDELLIQHRDSNTTQVLQEVFD